MNAFVIRLGDLRGMWSILYTFGIFSPCDHSTDSVLGNRLRRDRSPILALAPAMNFCSTTKLAAAVDSKSGKMSTIRKGQPRAVHCAAPTAVKADRSSFHGRLPPSFRRSASGMSGSRVELNLVFLAGALVVPSETLRLGSSSVAWSAAGRNRELRTG
jgi:hypothetical protein